MKPPAVKAVRCAIYTRVSTDHGLDQEFNSLDAQYDAASAYIKSQAHAGWTLIRSRYDDGAISGSGISELNQGCSRRVLPGAAFTSAEAPYSICCATVFISVRSITRTR